MVARVRNSRRAHARSARGNGRDNSTMYNDTDTHTDESLHENANSYADVACDADAYTHHDLYPDAHADRDADTAHALHRQGRRPMRQY